MWRPLGGLQCFHAEGASWGPLGGLLGASWGPRGGFLGAPKDLQEASQEEASCRPLWVLSPVSTRSPPRPSNRCNISQPLLRFLAFIAVVAFLALLGPSALSVPITIVDILALLARLALVFLLYL